MPYEHIEELGDRRQEKYLLGLTVQNLVGVLVLALPAMLLTGSAGVLQRALALAGAVTLGIVLTTVAGGLALYEWPLWWVRGRIRMLARGRIVRPEALHGSLIDLPVAPLRVGGPIQPACWDRQYAARSSQRGEHADI